MRAEYVGLEAGVVSATVSEVRGFLDRLLSIEHGLTSIDTSVARLLTKWHIVMIFGSPGIAESDGPTSPSNERRFDFIENPFHGDRLGGLSLLADPTGYGHCDQ